MTTFKLGEISICGDEAEAIFSRTFDHPTQAVWAALTRSDLRAQWLAPGEIELFLGGHVNLDFGDSGIVIRSQVSAYSPGRLLEYSWSGDGDTLRPLRWEISTYDGKAQLSLTLTMPASEDIARSCAGWEAHLEMLAATLEGVSIKFPFEHFKAAREAYKAKMGLVPA
jgi:uncharacterized protein YndB with AHSA1/START domain